MRGFYYWYLWLSRMWALVWYVLSFLNSIPKNHNNTSIPNSIQFQTSPITVEHLRDKNIALKTNNSQKINQPLPNIPHSVIPNQTVERNKKILPLVSHYNKSQRTLPVVIFTPNKLRAYTIPMLPSPQNRRLQFFRPISLQYKCFLPIKTTIKKIIAPSTCTTYYE